MRQTRTEDPRAANSLSWAQHELALEVLRVVLARCDRAGVPVLPVKGVATARILYDDVSERPITDVDLQIRRRDFWRWHEIATKSGWRSFDTVWTFHVRNYQFPGMVLDVQSGVGPPGMCSLSVDEMLARATPLALARDVRALVPEVHDHAILLAVNACKDWFANGNAYSREDLDRIVRLSGFQPQVFVERAMKSRIGTIGWLVANWMDVSYGNEVWRHIRSLLEKHTRVNRLSTGLYRRVAASPIVHSRSAPLFCSLSADGPLRQAAMTAAMVAWLAERWIRGHTGSRGRG